MTVYDVPGTVTRFENDNPLYVEQGATWSLCGRHRVALWRTWDPDLPTLLWGLLNPSTATEGESDPTNTRGEGYARAWGFGTNVFVNLFSIVTPDPKVMKKEKTPSIPQNDAIIKLWLGRSHSFMAGWGAHGSHRGRDKEMREIVQASGHDMMALKVLQGGQPGHPLYLKKKLQPFLYHGAL